MSEVTVIREPSAHDDDVASCRLSILREDATEIEVWVSLSQDQDEPVMFIAHQMKPYKKPLIETVLK